MYRIATILLAAAAVAFGLIIGTLNSDPVIVDLLWLQLEWPLGVVILVTLVLGLLIGLGLLWLTALLPTRRMTRRRSSKRPGAGIPSCVSAPH